MAVAEYSYDGKFEGNILIVGQTDCGKTTFIQNIAKNNLFGELKEIFWISKIILSTKREKKISACLNIHKQWTILIWNWHFFKESQMIM